MQASFTVEKHFVTDTLAAIELHAPSPVSTTETDIKFVLFVHCINYKP
jgi:hypothetical protein